jgi:superfamily II RNA helicase
MAGRAGRQGIDEKGWVFALLDETAIRYDDLVYFQSGRSEPVRSRFNLNYSAILNLFRRVGEAVPQAWERSLARFELEQRARTRSQDGRGARRGPRASSGARLIEARLRVLRAFHYVEGEDLTRKGTMCAHVNGYEIAVTEAYEGGWLFRCDAVQAAMLFASIVYESRPSDESARATRSLKGVQVPFQAHMATFAAEERAAGIRDETRGPDFGIAGPVQLWAEGMEFDRVLDHTTLSAGDLVRVLRMSIQLLRQAVHALPRGDPCIPVLEEARARIDRDVVDARRQLELG